MVVFVCWVSALRGWVGEDRRHNWIQTHALISTEAAQNINEDKKLKENLLTKELIEPIKEWTIQLGDRVR